MMVVAEARGFKFLALANDRSSNEGNTVHEGRGVNHQSAKGSAYIKLFNEYCAAKGLFFRYVSLCEEAYSLGAVNYLAKRNLPETPDYNEFAPVLAPSGIPEADKQALAQAIVTP